MISSYLFSCYELSPYDSLPTPSFLTFFGKENRLIFFSAFLKLGTPVRILDTIFLTTESFLSCQGGERGSQRQAPRAHFEPLPTFSFMTLHAFITPSSNSSEVGIKLILPSFYSLMSSPLGLSPPTEEKSKA